MNTNITHTAYRLHTYEAERYNFLNSSSKDFRYLVHCMFWEKDVGCLVSQFVRNIHGVSLGLTI